MTIHVTKHSPAISAPFLGFPVTSISANMGGSRPSFAVVMNER